LEKLLPLLPQLALFGNKTVHTKDEETMSKLLLSVDLEGTTGTSIEFRPVLRDAVGSHAKRFFPKPDPMPKDDLGDAGMSPAGVGGPKEGNSSLACRIRAVDTKFASAPTTVKWNRLMT
jgi:hypothetical protein